MIADEAYIRESIVDPNAKIVAGFQKDIMPTFQGLLNEEELLEVTEYIKSLSNTRSGMFTSEQTGPRRAAAGAVDLLRMPARVRSTHVEPA